MTTAKIERGFESTDPRTGTRLILLEGAEETGGRGWVMEIHAPEGAPAAVKEHVHHTWVETFEVVQGEARYKQGGKEGRLKAGERVVTPPGVPHVHPWNDGKGTLIFRQINDFGAVEPDAVHDVIGVFATINGLARAGMVRADGLPKSLLRAAVVLRTLNRYKGYDAKVPIAVQKLMGATLGRLGEALGYRAVDPKYLG